ncbi:MAG: hypothetical protein ABI290_12040 [Ginsengibacter sp.]
MKKLLLFAILFGAITYSFAQSAVPPAKAVVQKTSVVKTEVQKAPVKIVPTKTLKKQLASAMKRKKYSQAITIADTLLKRNSKDETSFFSKIGAQIMLKRDNDAVVSVKKWVKNKDSAATAIASIPSQFHFPAKRSGNVYYKAAIALAPKNGLPYMYYAAELADYKKADLAMLNAKKGYTMLPENYKKLFSPLYAKINYMSGNKEEAYKEMESELEKGNTTSDVITTYFKFYREDGRLEDGIKKVTEYIRNDSLGNYFVQRGIMYNDAGNSEKACEDAVTLKANFGEEDYWLKRFKCTQIFADAKPTMRRTYIYTVVFNNQEYDFRVSNPKVDMDNGVSFKYKLTGDVGYAGTVDISKEAITSAHDQMNKFGAEKIDLTDRTSVWISKEVFSEFKTNGTSTINANDWTGSREFTVVSETDNEDTWYPVEVDGETKYLRCFKVESKDGEELWINDDENNPIILKMNVDFTIELKSIL